MAIQELHWGASLTQQSKTAAEWTGAPRNYFIWTIGCQMNTADSDRLGSALQQMGLSQATSMKDADVVVLNSCVVRQSAEDKVTGTLGMLKPLKTDNPNRIVALMGCMVGPKTEELAKRFKHVDVFMQPQQYEPLINLLGERLGIDTEGCLSNLSDINADVTSFIPIIQGCDYFCSFCIIPYRRGRQASRPLQDILHEAELLAARGVREVTLLGQTVDAYGLDIPGEGDLADLLYGLQEVQGLDRIRFLTSHPLHMSDKIIQAVAELPKVCEHINLPIQAGDDDVLAAMRRPYTTDDYLRIIDKIRTTVSGVGLSTDLIVGFCGESDAAFRASYDLLEATRFDKVHVAQYSTREGTIADRTLVDDVPQEEKKRRLMAVDALQEQISTGINAQLLNQTMEVLVEGQDKGKWKGRTRTDKLVFFEDERDFHGRMTQVKITKTSPWSLQGMPVTD